AGPRAARRGARRRRAEDPGGRRARAGFGVDAARPRRVVALPRRRRRPGVGERSSPLSEGSRRPLKVRASAAATGAASVFVLALLGVLAGPATAKASLQFDGSSALSIDVGGDGTATTRVVVLNSGAKTKARYSIAP